jgi:4,5-epoxidase
MRKVGVLIIGAGPTGLALACDLRSRGISVGIVDQFEQPVTTTRALGLQPRGRQILDRLGAMGNLAKEALPQDRFDIYVDGRRVARVDLKALGGKNDDGALRAPQTQIERYLRERLHVLGAEVCWSHGVTDAHQDARGVDVTCKIPGGQETIRAEWVVGCDGAHSAVRDLMGAKFEGAAFPQTFLLGDVRLNPDRENAAVIYLREGQILAAASLPDGAWRIGVALPPGDPLASKGRGALTAARDHSSVSDAEGLSRLQELYADYSGDTATRLAQPSWLSVFRINRRMTSTYRQGRLLIAGDAAHLSSPLGGQGMNTGLGDAFNLGWKLALVAQGRAAGSLLDTYEAERRPAAASIEGATTQWTHILLGDGIFNRILRRAILLPMLRSTTLQGWVLTRRRALQSNYRGGPLARRTRFGWLGDLVRPMPRSGDEGPNPVCRISGHPQPTTLGRLLGNHWGLIFFGGTELGIGECVRIARARLGEDIKAYHARRTAPEIGSGDVQLLDDEAGSVARAYKSGKTTAILLRPDGHIAWRASSPHAGSLSVWLDTALGASPSS